jgi:hypothetical protein
MKTKNLDRIRTHDFLFRCLDSMTDKGHGAMPNSILEQIKQKLILKI